MRGMHHVRRALCLLLLCAASPALAQTHPLDPLTASEIQTAAKVIRAAPQFPANGRFATLVLKEPAKADVLAFRPGAAVARQAFAIIHDRAHNRAFEAVADVNASTQVSWTEV